MISYDRSYAETYFGEEREQSTVNINKALMFAGPILLLIILLIF